MLGTERTRRLERSLRWPCCAGGGEIDDVDEDGGDGDGDEGGMAGGGGAEDSDEDDSGGGGGGGARAEPDWPERSAPAPKGPVPAGSLAYVNVTSSGRKSTADTNAEPLDSPSPSRLYHINITSRQGPADGDRGRDRKRSGKSGPPTAASRFPIRPTAAHSTPIAGADTQATSSSPPPPPFKPPSQTPPHSSSPRLLFFLLSGQHLVLAMSVCNFSSGAPITAGLFHSRGPAHEHGHGHSHEHGGEHGHTHEVLEHPGKFTERSVPDWSARDFTERAFTVGIGGPVGSGKTALLLALCEALRDTQSLAVVTNDIFTREDAEFLTSHAALTPPERITAVETGGCPHAAIREDVSANMAALERLHAHYDTNLLFVESGGDNLAAAFSVELADFHIYGASLSA